MNRSEIRCSNIVDRKNKGKVRCSRFLAEISDKDIKIPCPKCGSLLIVSRDYRGYIKCSISPRENAIIQNNKKEK